jgi:putative aldouronate transport system substrate-binding protein
MKKILSLIVALVMILLAGAASADVTLRAAVGYSKEKTGITFDAETAGEGVTLADGVTYHTGDLKPTWVEFEKILSDKLGTPVVFENKWTGNGGVGDEFEYWKDRLNEVDIITGGSSVLSEYGEAGSLINLAEHYDKLPNFKAYLDANPIVRLSITGNTKTGAVYFAPYFDGVDDIEKMPLMRVDYLQKLLDGDEPFAADACKDTAAPVYQPYMPVSGKVEVEAMNADGTGVQTLTKDYDAFGNIVAKMNEKGAMSGVDAVNMFREYIDKTYNGYYGSTRSNLFMGYDAAWDADELVALLRCVVANPQSLNGTDSIQGLFSREENNTSRRADLFRFGASLFGVRGLESRKDYLYFGTDGELHDARMDKESYEMAARMHDMALEGLISKDFIDKAETSSTKNYLPDDLGFMSYDYNQTQTLMNQTALQEGEKYMAVMVPVALWFDGTEGGHYMRFTESWRSVKPTAWAISKAGVESNEGALDAALAMFDYAYSPEGQILLSYGPAAFIEGNETFLFNGKEMPVIGKKTYEDLWALGKGNYTNFARYWLGSTLGFVKSQAFEYQCTHEVGKEGAAKLSAGIGLGTIHHPFLEIAENPWYTSVPTTLPLTKVESEEVNGYTEISTSGKFGTEKASENLYVDIIVNGLTGTAEEIAQTVATDWHGEDALLLMNDAWLRLADYYATLQ